MVNNNYGSVTSAVASLTVLLVQPGNQTVGIGQSASLKSVSSQATLGYQWTFNGENLSGATNSTLTLDNVQTNQAGNYAVTITTPAGIMTSSVAILTTLSATIHVVSNVNDFGAGSLRQAINDANSYSGSQAIIFNIPGAGPFTISPLTPLPVINNTVNIDATTQPGWAGAPVVQISGSSVLLILTMSDGLVVAGNSCMVKGLNISGFPGNGIELAGGSSNVIQGNYLGCALDGITKKGNGNHGIFVYNSANNIIGGTNALTRNVIVYSGNDGIHLEGTGTTNNQVLGNIIGNSFPVPWAPGRRNGNGIVITNASGNFIGGTNDGAGNVSSGNKASSGLLIAGPNASLNIVQGNFFGTDITGVNAAKNSMDGITILNSSSNTIGGPAFAGNVISGNSGNGSFHHRPVGAV